MSVWELRHLATMRELRAKTDDELRRLWDAYDGTNEPDGFAGEDIHLVLNERGLGAYCAV